MLFDDLASISIVVHGFNAVNKVVYGSLISDINKSKAFIG